MEYSLIFGLIAGLGYATAALVSKRATKEGLGVFFLSLVINFAFLPVFALPLIKNGFSFPNELSLIYQPAITGFTFFLGQVFTFAAIRVGDVSLHTPVMGAKAVFVVWIAVFWGTEEVSGELWLAALLSFAAVILLSFSGGKFKQIGLTLFFALASALFFAFADSLVGSFGKDFGTSAFLFLTMVVNAMLSLLLIPLMKWNRQMFKWQKLRWAFMAGLFMAGQALLLNWTMAEYRNVSAINIMYSSRGFWSVVLAVPLGMLLSLPREITQKRFFALRIIGALLMSAAIFIVI